MENMVPVVKVQTERAQEAFLMDLNTQPFNGKKIFGQVFISDTQSNSTSEERGHLGSFHSFQQEQTPSKVKSAPAFRSSIYWPLSAEKPIQMSLLALKWCQNENISI